MTDAGRCRWVDHVNDELVGRYGQVSRSWGYCARGRPTALQTVDAPEGAVQVSMCDFHADWLIDPARSGTFHIDRDSSGQVVVVDGAIWRQWSNT